ncbi:SDR family oxidoreductase [Pendulispora rubella]|uniref:dTDP-4-dehydrorhamnose reductase n=1 Tax=Pendulispora rubella TaxID=2741070 RepID=A0ABZ2KZR3_9BACT
MNAARVLVIGASGLVGSAFVRRARARGLDVIGSARRVFGEATVALDLQDPPALERVLNETAPDIVVIGSAWPHVDGCEEDPARSQRENVDTVRNVVELVDAKRALSNTRIVFYSTDHVFDGAKPGARYVESDPPNPPSVYARHKRAAEELLLARENALIVRTAWVFGAELRRKNFVYRVIDLANTGRPLEVPRGQAGCPTWSDWLCESTLSLLGRGMTGVVHLAGRRALTKAEWAEAIVTNLGLPALHVEEVDAAKAGQIAPRPERVDLVSERCTLEQEPVEQILRRERERLLGPA